MGAKIWVGFLDPSIKKRSFESLAFASRVFCYLTLGFFSVIFSSFALQNFHQSQGNCQFLGPALCYPCCHQDTCPKEHRKSKDQTFFWPCQVRARTASYRVACKAFPRKSRVPHPGRRGPDAYGAPEAMEQTSHQRRISGSYVYLERCPCSFSSCLRQVGVPHKSLGQIHHKGRELSNSYLGYCRGFREFLSTYNMGGTRAKKLDLDSSRFDRR